MQENAGSGEEKGVDGSRGVAAGVERMRKAQERQGELEG